MGDALDHVVRATSSSSAALPRPPAPAAEEFVLEARVIVNTEIKVSAQCFQLPLVRGFFPARWPLLIKTLFKVVFLSFFFSRKINLCLLVQDLGRSEVSFT